MSKNEEKKKGKTNKLIPIAAVILLLLYGGLKLREDRETTLPALDTKTESKEWVQVHKKSVPANKQKKQPTDQLWLMIEGKPDGQTIFLDQFELGLLPASILVEPGFHTVECRKEGYISRTVRVRGNSNHPVNVNCILQKILQKTAIPDNNSIVE